LGIGIEEAAIGIRDVANANMVRAIRAITTERGVDARDFALLAFGGSGPAHACDLARMLGIARVLFPPVPGVFTAMGMLAGSVERHFLRPFSAPLATLDISELRTILDSLASEARRVLAEEGYADGVEIVAQLDLRFTGQDLELPVTISPTPTPQDLLGLRPAFLETYRANFGYVSQDAVEAVNLRLTARVTPRQAVSFTELRMHASATGSSRSRPTYMDRSFGWVDTPVIDRVGLTRPHPGPVVLESSDSTIVVPQGGTASPTVGGSVLVTLSAG
jgi:N-methylhydantoinase A